MDDIAFLLRLGEPVPPDVQNYLADLLDGSLSRSKGRPKKHPGQIDADRLEAAKALFEAINNIRNKADISVAKACACYAAAKGKKGLRPETVEREYWAAKKGLTAAFIEPMNRNTNAMQYFLTHRDYLSWERDRLKAAKNSEK